MEPLCEQNVNFLFPHIGMLAPELCTLHCDAFQVHDIYRSQRFGHTQSLWRYRALIARNSRLVGPRIAPTLLPTAREGQGGERK